MMEQIGVSMGPPPLGSFDEPLDMELPMQMLKSITAMIAQSDHPLCPNGIRSYLSWVVRCSDWRSDLAPLPEHLLTYDPRSL